MTNTIQTGIKEEERRKSVLDAFMTDLGSIQNINILDQDYNKQQVTDFVRGKRAEYAKLADAYHKTKDTNILDKMDAIKFSFNNLNQQLQGLVNERKEYLTAHEKGQLIGLPGDGIYVDMYTNKSKFSIGGNGDIGFSNNGVYSKFKDVAGKWNVNNNIYKNAFLKLDGGVVARASKGGKFDKVGITNQISSLLSSQGVEEAQVAFKTDVVGDENMIIGKDKDGNNILAGNLSFESIWSKGGMDPEFYRGYNKNADGSYDTKWMFENKNSAEGIRLKAMYDAKVLEQRHNNNFVVNNSNKKGRDGLNLSYGYRTNNQIKISYDQIVAGKKEIKGLNGTIWKRQINGKYKHEESGTEYTPNELKSYFEFDHLPNIEKKKVDLDFINFNVPNKLDKQPENPNN